MKFRVEDRSGKEAKEKRNPAYNVGLYKNPRTRIILNKIASAALHAPHVKVDSFMGPFGLEKSVTPSINQAIL